MESMALIKKINFDPEFEPLLDLSPLITHDLVEGMDKAKGLLVRARQESARLRKRAREVLAEAQVKKEEERKIGFEEGKEEGLASLTERITTVEQAREKVLKEAEPEVIRMVMEIAEKVIGREIERGAVLDIVQQTIGQSVGQKIVLRINPQDIPRIKKEERRLLAAIGEGRSILVKEDGTIPAGGCIVETELGTVDARLETQMGAIRKALGL